ncbi:hypothetical protein HYALB_00009816 [Hymenoscyphus albidus]|uniref:Uncharacterized protein n=1 Tax=Hymenoscyphus albidus TaxID=595503 RepID=A0A9N9Q9N3_9HELO|nr:hypothetical protein HYALB_00009816 [Hymenoscyphus albidus]
MESIPESTDRDAHGSKVEEILVRALSYLSPTDIIKSEKLEASFREFLERGTAENCWRLVPLLHREVFSARPKSPLGIDVSNFPPSNSSHDNSPSRASAAPQDTPLTAPPSSTVSSSNPISEPTSQCHSSPNTIISASTLSGAALLTEVVPRPASADASSSGSNGIAAAYFEKILGHDKQIRVQRLVRTVRGLEKAAALPLQSYERLWSTKGKIFEGSETGPSGRLCRLQRGRQKIRQGNGEYECASRLSLLFLANDVDHIYSSNKLKLSSGRGRKTIAFEELAESSGISLNTLKDDYKKSRGYMQLLAEEGPGSVLEVGSEVTANWEKNLTKEDIRLVIQYREDKLPDLGKRARSLNAPAARAIVDGLLAYGWTYPEILSIRSELMKHVTPYLEMDKLANDMAQKSEKASLNGDTDLSSKRRYGDDIDVDSAKICPRCCSEPAAEVIRPVSKPISKLAPTPIAPDYGRYAVCQYRTSTDLACQLFTPANANVDFARTRPDKFTGASSARVT